MATKHNALMCRWAEPTFFVWGDWAAARRHPWCCVRDDTARMLVTPEACSNCPRWQPRWEEDDSSAAERRADWTFDSER
jgi:hypothetical protein